MIMASFRFGRRHYEWRQDGRSCELISGGQVVARIIADETYAGMYRVKVGDAPPSDMIDLTRAKDAAVSLADRAIETGRPRMRGASPISETGQGATTPPDSAPWLPGLDIGGACLAREDSNPANVAANAGFSETKKPAATRGPTR